MTESLKKLMDDTAAGAQDEFAPVDMSRLFAEGDRAVRRRRTLVTGGVGLVAAALAVGGLALGSGWGDDERGVDVASTPTAAVTWIQGGALHTPDGELPLGHTAVAYVRNAVGYVFVADDGAVYSIVDEQVEQVGRTRLTGAEEQLLLLADPQGTRIAWIDPTTRGRFVSLDLATGTRESFGTDGAADGLLAADGDTFYVEYDGEAVAYDATAQTITPIEDRLLDRPDILGAGNGLLATTVDGDPADGDGGGIRIAEPGEQGVVIPEVWADSVQFSPDAAHVSADADELQVFDTRTGDRVEFDMGGRPFASVYEWLDDDTVAAIASAPGVANAEDEAQLITCELSSGACEVVADDLGSFGELVQDGFLVPIGLEIG